jgi:hypothetical protein
MLRPFCQSGRDSSACRLVGRSQSPCLESKARNELQWRCAGSRCGDALSVGARRLAIRMRGLLLWEHERENSSAAGVV